MHPDDIKGFFANEESLIMDDYLVFTYLVETAGDPREVASSLASEISTAQWKRPGVGEDLRPLYGAKVTSLDVLEELRTSAFAGAAAAGRRYSRCRVRIAYPHRNFGTRIPNLLTAAMGEGAFFCSGVTAIKLVDIEFPGSYLADFQGPKFGTAGIRRMLSVFDRPLFFGVVKPNVGLDPRSFAGITREALIGGLDAAKDDEMLADPSYSPFDLRMRLVGQARSEAEQATGEAKIFIANITDEVDRLILLHDIAVKNGINAVMVNAVAVGLSAVRSLRKQAAVPIVAHFDCIAPMSRHPHFGVATTVMTKLQRVCGCDAIIMPGFGARMMTPEDEVLSNVSCCLAPMGDIASSLPVPGGSDWAGTLPSIYEKLRTLDFAMVPGRGVFGHPMGPRAGAASLRQAWEAVAQRIGLVEHARANPELREALVAFGGNERDEDSSDGLSTPLLGFTGVSLDFRRH